MNLSRIPVGWPEDKEAIPYGALAGIFASAVTPLSEQEEAEGDLEFHLTLADYESRLCKAVREGALVIRNPVTWEPLPCWTDPSEAIVRVDDLKAHLERTGSVIELIPLKNEPPLPEPVTWQGHTYQPGPEPTPEEADDAAAWAGAVNKAEATALFEKQNWYVEMPQRFSPYGPALYKYLCNEWRKGRLRKPTARDVMEAWQVAKPAEIHEVMQDGVKYIDNSGNVKELTLKALKAAIGRMAKSTP